MTQATVNGNTYSDDGTSERDMRGYGYTIWFFPLINDFLEHVVATLAKMQEDIEAADEAKTAAGTARDEAQTARSAAQGARDQAGVHAGHANEAASAAAGSANTANNAATAAVNAATAAGQQAVRAEAAAEAAEGAVVGALIDDEEARDDKTYSSSELEKRFAEFAQLKRQGFTPISGVGPHQLERGKSYAVFSLPGAVSVMVCPAAPADGDRFWLTDMTGSWSDGPPQLQRNGQLIMGLAENMGLDFKNASLEVSFNVTRGWVAK